MTSLAQFFSELLLILTLGVGALFGSAPSEAPVGGVQVAADFSSSLVSSISANATTMTLVSTSTPSGEHLVQGQTYGFKLGGREYVLGTLSSGREITGMTRGLSLVTGTTTAGVAEAWGRGTAVEITDAPILLQLSQQASGRQGFDAPVFYESSVSTSTIALDTRNLVSVQLLNDTAFAGAGIIDATSLARGVVELATGAEAAASTASGGSGVLVLPASIATSTRNANAAANVVLVSNASGRLESDWITKVSTTTTVGETSILNGIAKNVQVFTSTGTSTFSVPDGVTKVFVEVQGAGGGGGAGGGNVGGGGGGGGGGYANEIVDVTGTSTIQVFVGAGGAAASNGQWSTFGTNGEFLSATGGSAGTAASTGDGGAGGVGQNGDINIKGSGGCGGKTGDTDDGSNGVCGGSSHLGGGAEGKYGSGSSQGAAGGNYGGGGGGGVQSGNSGGAGAQGIVIVRW